MLLKPNAKWRQNQGIALPTVLAETTITKDYFQVNFTVEEPLDCFRAEVLEDGGRSWEDSCVEVFLQNPAKPEEYFNFETTSRGFILAARGEGRMNRTILSADEIASIERTKQLASVIGDFISWGISIRISAKIFGLKTFEGETLKGNIYKCADLAKTPHYLSAFPIETDKPDFHRPEFFQNF
ncbi:MAG: hypothetical protein MJY82_08210 [Fibrobacter sp.]|nr:hypothetical protein [Fibrobacter sp.]